MIAGGLQGRSRTTSIHWPLTAGRYSVAQTCCPLTMDSFSVGRPDNPASRRAYTQRGETTVCDDLHNIEDIICYIRQVGS
jgi:hypothetical protein